MAMSEKHLQIQDDNDDTVPIAYSGNLAEEETSILIPKSAVDVKEDFVRPTRSLILTLIIVFFVNTGFAIVIPSLSPLVEKEYGRPTWQYGMVVAAYSAGQFAISPIFGYWANRRPTREVLFTSLLLGTAGNILYCWAPNVWVLLVSRFIVGMGAGNVAVARAYVSHATTTRERTAFMANVSAAQTVGFVLGPAIGSGLSGANFHIGAIEVNKYWAPAYLSAILNAGSIIPLIWFQEVPFGHSHEGITSTVDEGPNRVGVIVAISLFFITISEFAVLETVAVPYTDNAYGWGPRNNGFVFAGMFIE